MPIALKHAAAEQMLTATGSKGLPESLVSIDVVAVLAEQVQQLCDAVA